MSKPLVAYFSPTGTTANVAKMLASAVGADLHEILPAQPYTKADLDWNNPKSRSSMEMNDPASRPAIAGNVQNMEQYNTIYLGFPIWWYVAPNIINTFLEQYDLTGKVIIPFATSGSSSMGKTNEVLKRSCPGAVLKSGKRFPATVTVAELKTWAESMV